ncbi:mycofactocin biosynthesis chaperone MftB [Nocardioides marmoriginsengisoli]|uniref:Mycofactocin biosynthesis chaperone MftB n=1 Tax=Nocardioides marmoriginsengisoli TaxID=661483 RepID=A0A3N0CDK1_9ACTN|nr:mycofactocin biosynthesis chaperone MftB [Nocardioides marmoriginsengisoli]RNL61311.1 mycofactocin biosynthesis chaperone MftB [Nocardioides marmoriginsengisoli]
MIDEPWALAGGVELRPEPFGALAYNFTNRRLTFLKSTRLVDVVRGLAAAPDVRTALTRAEVPDREWPTYLEALGGLAETQMIQHRSTRDDS